MTADFDNLLDLEEYDTMCKGYVDSLNETLLIENSQLNSPSKKSFLPSFEAYPVFNSSLFDTNKFNYDLPNPAWNMDWESPPCLPLFGTNVEESLGFSNDFHNALMHTENESDFLIVNPISLAPSPVKNESEEEEEKDDDFDESLESVLSEDLMDLTDEKLIKIVDSDFSSLISLDDILTRPSRKFSHLDFDHSYSARPEGLDDDFNSPPSPASSSSSEKTIKAKRGRPPKNNIPVKKIKQEPCSEDEDEDEDVEGPFTVSLVVPKITLALSPPPSPPTPPKRGRKPKNKIQGQKNKKSKNKNCPVSPKVLEEAIKQQKKKNYVTKSGRVTKISHSVESTPSSSTQSSQSSSRCSSDNEDNADKRASHNQAERQRRQQLTDLFQILRKRIPTLASNPKASKVAILTQAAHFVVNLEDIEKMKKHHKEQSKLEAAKKLSIMQSLMNSRVCSS